MEVKMEKIKLCNSDLSVSRLCFGGCPMGGYGWGEVSRSELIYAVNFAVDNGVNFFDTADTYGLGESERTLAEALGDKRKDVVIATKFGVRVENGKTFYDNSRDYIRAAVENSLRRLCTDYIDIYQIHYRDGITPLTEVVDTLEKLKTEGKIRYYGLSNVYTEDIAEIEKSGGKFITFQDEYSLACRKNEEDINRMSKTIGMNPLTWGSLGQGILSGKYDVNSKFDINDRRSREIYTNFHGEKLIHNLKIVECLKNISAKTEKPIPAVALRFILDYINNSCIIVGVKKTKQIQDNLCALGWNLSRDDINLLEKVSRQ